MGPVSKNKGKRKDRQIPGSCLRAKKNCGTWKWLWYQLL